MDKARNASSNPSGVILQFVIVNIWLVNVASAINKQTVLLKGGIFEFFYFKIWQYIFSFDNYSLKLKKYSKNTDSPISTIVSKFPTPYAPQQ